MKEEAEEFVLNWRSTQFSIEIIGIEMLYNEFGRMLKLEVSILFLQEHNTSSLGLSCGICLQDVVYALMNPQAASLSL